MIRIHRAAVLASGGGSNLGAILDAQRSGILTRARVELVVGSKPGIGALERARVNQIPFRVIEKERPLDLVAVLTEYRIDLILLAGYLRKLPPEVISRYRGKILNIHPALLPKYGGMGMYGRHVHEAVLQAGDRESGCSVHVVDEEFDHGPVIGQTRVPVEPGDTAEQLARRVLAEEHKLYPKLIEEYCQHHD